MPANNDAADIVSTSVHPSFLRRMKHRIGFDPVRVQEVCLDCGVTVMEMDDNLVTSCESVAEGPNRDAIVILRREVRAANSRVERMRRDLTVSEAAIVGLSNSIREADARRRELEASLAQLEAA